uniref:Uncharacterized protein n=1 Tax=Panagrolaimus davidi TaxID=227884 RepID=A0A914PAQ8_9BILA
MPELTNAIIKESDAIPQLIKFIENQLTFESVIKILTKMITENPEDLRKIYLNHEIIVPILMAFSPYDQKTFSEDVFIIIENLFEEENRPESGNFRLFIAIWANLIHEFDASIVLQTIETIGHLSKDKNDDEFEKYFIDKRVIKHLVQLINHNETYIHTSLAICLTYITRGSGEQIQHIFDSGILENFDKLLNNQDYTVHLCATILLSKLITKNEEQYQAVFNSKYIPIIMEYFKSEISAKRQVATKFFTKAVLHGKTEHILYFLKLNLVCYFSQHLKEHEMKNDDKSKFHLQWIEQVFKVFQSIFEKIPKSESKNVSLEIIKCGGNDVITKFVKKENSEISELAVKIIYEMGRAMDVLDLNDLLHDDL